MILPLEKQVCSLESAKRLKELGFPQESLFYWWVRLGNNRIISNNDYICFLSDGDEQDYISAYTVAELGELLPYTLDKLHRLECYKGVKNHGVSYYCGITRRGICEFQADTEVEARAKMLIYLKENKLI